LVSDARDSDGQVPEHYVSAGWIAGRAVFFASTHGHGSERGREHNLPSDKNRSGCAEAAPTSRMCSSVRLTDLTGFFPPIWQGGGISRKIIHDQRLVLVHCVVQYVITVHSGVH
jgi:hypothetical protein